MRRVLVIGLDGLDHELVDELQLDSLKQAQHGSFPSVINKKLGVPVSPQVWGSFLTGKVQNIDGWKRLPSSMSVAITNLPHVLKKALLWIVKKNDVVAYVNKDDLDLDGVTIDDAISSHVVCFPLINYNVSQYLGLYYCAFDEPSKWRQETWKLFDSALAELEDTVKLLRSDEEAVGDKLVLSYFPILDGYGHLYMEKYPHLVGKAYHEVDYKVGSLLRQVPEEVLVIIVSDHGMNSCGEHSDTCFYSLSQPREFNPKSVTDFYDFILEEVSG